MIKRSNPYGGYFPSIFDEFFNDFTKVNREEAVPAVNVKENEKQFTLELAAPGLKRDDFNLEVESDRLVISAEVKHENTTEDDKYTRKEFSYQSFKRSFSLPEGEINTDEIKAKYADGVLSIDLPKRKEEEVKASKRISIA
ncbi:MAG: Hsp20/alpha crystallin family protein [Salibacteraceae bacterium]